jgi:histidinol-phosphate aminotransferase
LIQASISAAGSKGEGLVTVDPGFSVYPRAAVVQGLKVFLVALRKDYSFDVDALLEAGRHAKIMFLALPNNPTGTTLSLPELEFLSQNFQGLLVVDEAYFEYSGETACGLVRSRPNVVVLRTFSKALGLAGLRLGYLLAPPELSREIEKAKLPFSVGLIQQLAGEFVLEQRSRLLVKTREVVAERDRMFEALQKLPGLSPVPSKANFILFKCRDFAPADLFRKLHENGVLVRFFDSPALKDMLRVTIGTSSENSRFLRVLRGLIDRSLP